MEIRRFGPGHRRPEGPAGTAGLTGQVIWSDERANVSELAFSRRAVIPPHENPNTTLFIVVSGGGFVQVGDERIRINHGEAVVWPPNVPHGAYTDGVEMRAIVVELTEGLVSPDSLAALAGLGALLPSAVLEGMATEPGVDEPVAGTKEGSGAPASPTVEPGRGQLAERLPSRDGHDESEGEPW
jgi:quercetin dioxygenase-like cupin family protein